MDKRIEEFINNNSERQKLYNLLGCPEDYYDFMDRLSEHTMDLIIKEEGNCRKVYAQHFFKCNLYIDDMINFIKHFAVLHGLTPQELADEYGVYTDWTMYQLFCADSKKKKLHDYLDKPTDYAELIARTIERVKSYDGEEDKLAALVALSNHGLNKQVVDWIINPTNRIPDYAYQYKSLKDSYYGYYNEVNPFSNTVHSPYTILLERIDSMSNQEDITKLLHKCEFSKETFSYLMSNVVHDFLVRKYGQNFDKENEESLLSKLVEFGTYIAEEDEETRKQKEEEKQEEKRKFDIEFLFDANELVLDYVQSGAKSIAEYCKSKNITPKDFKFYIDILKNYSSIDYEKYEEISKRNSAIAFAKAMNCTKKIVEYLKSGIELPDGTKRTFDIIDFYLIAGSRLNDEQLFKAVSERFTRADYVLLKNFLSKNKNNRITANNKNRIVYETTYSFVDGEGIRREATLDEREDTFRFLKSHKVPINDGTFTIGLRRHLKGQLIPRPTVDLDLDALFGTLSEDNTSPKENSTRK